MDGLTLAAEIRKSGALPLIMLTLAWYRSMVKTGVKFAAYLTKPIKPSQLYDTLNRGFGRTIPHRSKI